MKRSAALLALIATGCTTMEPPYVRPDPAVPPSWPAGDPYILTAEAGLPALTYKQVFEDPRLQTLIAEALVNNRDMMIAASNIAAAREQYRIQRANHLPTVAADGGVTVIGDDDD
jgi:multidrug efflux system outer membrane protein